MSDIPLEIIPRLSTKPKAKQLCKKSHSFSLVSRLVNSAQTIKKAKKASVVSYQPVIPETGRYAVYVSYATLANSADDVVYTVWHKGQATQFHVNQTMGGGTWVYLGTFDFDKGCNEFNRVEVSNASRQKGFVTTDAVRFGGGMGNIERGGYVSNMPRALEGARYYAQWAGAPYSIYSTSPYALRKRNTGTP